MSNKALLAATSISIPASEHLHNQNSTQALPDSAKCKLPLYEKLYGYHRLEDPLIPVLLEDNTLSVKTESSLQEKIVPKEGVLIGRHDEHLKPVEPKKW